MGAEEARVKTQQQQNIAIDANIKAEKATTDTEKATLRPNKPKMMLKKLNIVLIKQMS